MISGVIRRTPSHVVLDRSSVCSSPLSVSRESPEENMQCFNSFAANSVKRRSQAWTYTTNNGWIPKTDDSWHPQGPTRHRIWTARVIFIYSAAALLSSHDLQDGDDAAVKAVLERYQANGQLKFLQFAPKTLLCHAIIFKMHGWRLDVECKLGLKMFWAYCWDLSHQKAYWRKRAGVKVFAQWLQAS